MIMPIASTLLNPTDAFIDQIANAAMSGEVVNYGDYANHISGRRRMVGVGTMLVGGLYTLVIMREALMKGITEMIELEQPVTEDGRVRTDQDLPSKSIASRDRRLSRCLRIQNEVYGFLQPDRDHVRWSV